MQDRHVINSSYYCERERPGGPILILTTGAYVVAQYNERTGEFRYERLVPANLKPGIEKWLQTRFPPKLAAEAKA